MALKSFLLALLLIAIPRVWDDPEMAALQLPLADSTASPKQISSDYYYRIPVRTIYKNYPVYAPGKEPAGYLEWLKQQEPQSGFDTATLRTEADWIRAGQLVFDSPRSGNKRWNRLASRGQKVFEREGCGGCHTPPLYTSNKLVPVEGFEVPKGSSRAI